MIAQAFRLDHLARTWRPCIRSTRYAWVIRRLAAVIVARSETSACKIVKKSQHVRGSLFDERDFPESAREVAVCE